MKNFVIGLIVGVLVTLGANEFLGDKNDTLVTVSESKVDITGTIQSDGQPSLDEILDQVQQKNIEKVELLQAEVKDLVTENRDLKEKLETNEESSEKEQKPKVDVFNFDDIEVTQGDLEIARNNIQVAMQDASKEYQDFMQKHLDGALSDLEFVGYSEKGWVDHYKQSVDYQWAPEAELFLNTFFSEQPNNKYRLIRSKCHSHSCELFAQYISEEHIARDKMPLISMSIFEFMRGMHKAPNFDKYFSIHSTMNTSIAEDEMSIFIHSVMRKAVSE